MKSATFRFGFVLALLAPVVVAAPPRDYNKQVLRTVDWLAKNKAGLGYDLYARYTEDLQYGDRTFRATKGTKTMCVAAVFEVLVRTLADAKTADGKLATELLTPGQLGGNSALALQPYIFQFKSNATFSEYGRKFSAGAGDAFVLFGIGRYVTFNEAKPGDFLYFNRSKGGGHAVVFMGFLDVAGELSESARSAVGFRYFSAQEGGTKGIGFRDAFFGSCPSVQTIFKKDCGLIRSDKRALFSVSRLHAPDEWFPKYSAIRVDRHLLKGETMDGIYADEARFRTEAVAQLEEANRISREKTKAGLFPLEIPEVVTETIAAENLLKSVEFDEFAFGPDFSEPAESPEEGAR